MQDCNGPKAFRPLQKFLPRGNKVNIFSNSICGFSCSLSIEKHVKEREYESMMDSLSNSGINQKDDTIIGMMFEDSDVDTIKILEDYLFLNDCNSKFVNVNFVDMYLEIASFVEQMDNFDRKLMK